MGLPALRQVPAVQRPPVPRPHVETLGRDVELSTVIFMSCHVITSCSAHLFAAVVPAVPAEHGGPRPQHRHRRPRPLCLHPALRPHPGVIAEEVDLK